jgi:hypothetical protein
MLGILIDLQFSTLIFFLFIYSLVLFLFAHIGQKKNQKKNLVLNQENLVNPEPFFKIVGWFVSLHLKYLIIVVYLADVPFFFC